MPSVEAVRALMSICHTAPSADNSQPWHFSWNGEKLSISFASTRIAGNTFAPNSSATLLSMGGIIENFALMSEHCGFYPDIELFPLSEITETYATLNLSGKEIPESFSSHNPVSQRHTNRFPYKKTLVSAIILEPLSEAKEGSARLSTYSLPEHIHTLAGFIKSASQVRFQTREVHEWLSASLRFSALDVKKADGLDVQTLDLPPGGAQFLKFTGDWKRMSLLNKIGAYRFMATIDSAPIKVAPAIVAICAPATELGAIEAGRLLTRAWTSLNTQGLAVQPYYVISDQIERLAEGKVPEHLVGQVEKLKHMSKQFFELESNETVHMLLRIGYPAQEAPRSLRLPIERVFSDLTSRVTKL